MSEQDADRIRNAIARDQRWTLCRCGHILECCADCMDWMRENSLRIAQGWRWYIDHCLSALSHVPAGQVSIDEIEAYYLAYYESQR